LVQMLTRSSGESQEPSTTARATGGVEGDRRATLAGTNMDDTKR
jgi:hypothetical protein